MSDAPDQYAGISEIYDAWCLEVQEDIGFYVGMALGTQTAVIEQGFDRFVIGRLTHGHSDDRCGLSS